MVYKKQIIAAMTEKAGLSQKYATIAIDAFMAAVTDALKQGEQVVLTDFGTFLVKCTSERDGHNPQTGEKIRIPARRVPAFRAAKKLRQSIPQE